MSRTRYTHILYKQFFKLDKAEQDLYTFDEVSTLELDTIVYRLKTFKG